MTDIRSFFSRSRKAPGQAAGRGVRGTQAERLAQAIAGSEAAAKSDSKSNAPAGIPQTMGSTATKDSKRLLVEPKPSEPEARPSRSSRGGEQRDDVMGLIRKMRDHLDAQSTRTEKLIDIMNSVPKAVEALPDLHRQNSRMVEILTDHLDQSAARESRLETTMTRINEASEEQTKVLGLIQQQLDTGGQATLTMTKTIASLRGSLDELASTNTRSVDTLSRMSAASERRESTLGTALTKTHRWMIAATIICGTMSAGALTLVAVMLIKMQAGG